MVTKMVFGRDGIKMGKRDLPENIKKVKRMKIGSDTIQMVKKNMKESMNRDYKQENGFIITIKV